MERFSRLAVVLLFSFCKCTLTQEVDGFSFDGYAPENVGEGNPLYETGFNPDDIVDVEDNNYPDREQYPGVGENGYSETNDQPEVPVGAKDDSYQPVSAGAEGDENFGLGGYQPVDAVDNGELVSAESKDYSEVSADVEGENNPETADLPEYSVVAEGDENPELGGYQPVDVVDSGELVPAESKDYSEVSADVDDDKYLETEGYAPVNVANGEGYEPSLTKDYPEETVDLEDNSVETNVSPITVTEGDKYPESELEPENAEDTEKYEPSDNYNNPTVSDDIEPYVTSSYPEIIVDVEENEPLDTTSYPEDISDIVEKEAYLTTSYPEVVGDGEENEPSDTTNYPEAVADIEPNEPYETTSYPELTESYETTYNPMVTDDIDLNEPYDSTRYPEVVSDVDKNEPYEPNGNDGMAGDTDTTGMEVIPTEEEMPQEIPPDETPCNYEDLNGLANLLIRNVRPMIPDRVYLPDRRHGPFKIRSFFVRGVSRFARSGQPVIACSDNYVTLNIPLYWEKPLIGHFQLSVASLSSEVKVILQGLEAEAILDLQYASSSTYVVYVRAVRFTRSNAPIVVTSNMGYFHRIAGKLASFMANIFQARIRQFLSGQFQQILQEQIVKTEVAFNYRGYYRSYY